MSEFNLNFGNIKDVYHSLLSESMGAKDHPNKSKFKTYIKKLNESKLLGDLFMLHYNIENKVVAEGTETPNISEYIKLSISAFDKYDRKEIKEALLDLASNILSEEVTTDYPESELAKVHESINTLLLTPNTIKTVDELHEANTTIVNYIKNNTVKENIDKDVILPTSMVSALHVDIFNEEYANISEEEKQIIISIMESDDDAKEELFKQEIAECLELINNHLTEADIDTKEKLLEVKEDILSKEYDAENFVSNISKMINLKNDLK